METDAPPVCEGCKLKADLPDSVSLRGEICRIFYNSVEGLLIYDAIFYFLTLARLPQVYSRR
jgi:hypothetical protein